MISKTAAIRTKISFRTLISALFIFAATAGLHAQADVEGTWYITNGNNTARYLVPSLGGYWQDDEDTPYVTTYPTGKDANSVWTIIRAEVDGETYYRFFHNLTGKYITFNDVVDAANPDRLRFHLEAFSTPSDATLFVVEKPTADMKIAVRPKGYDGGANNRWWFDISGGNKDNYWNGNYEGCLGLWRPLNEVSQSANFYLYEATPVCAIPAIAYDEGTHCFTISYPVADGDVSLHYTTDGTAPTEASPTYDGSPIAEDDVPLMLRAIATKSGCTNSPEARLYAPNRPVMLKTSNTYNHSYYIMPPVDDASTTDLYVTTSNVPNAKMAWLLKPAGLHNGVQYYYIVNQVSGKYMYCRVNRNQGSAIVMKPLGEEGTEAARYQFRLWEGNGYTLILPKPFAYIQPTTGSQNMLFKSGGDNHTNPLSLESDNANGNSRWQIIGVPDDPRTLWPLDEQASTSASTTYWKLQSVSGTSYYLCPPNVSTSHLASARTDWPDMEWVIEPATDADTWAPFYHIRNGQSGQYLSFRGLPGYQNTFFLTPSDNPDADDALKFIIVRTANTDAPNSYAIIPKPLRNQPNQANNSMFRNSNTMQTATSRQNNGSHWNFVAVSNFVSPPTFAQQAEDGPVSIGCLTAGATIHYTTDGSAPTAASPAYTTPITPAAGAITTIRAIAVKDGTSSTEASFSADRTTRPTGYYVLHQSGTGYLKVNGGDVNLSNENSFRTDDIFNNGSSIWVLTGEGYLQNHYYYLNVANNQTLYLDATPRTRWSAEDVAGSTKKHLYIGNGATRLYLCYDGGVKLSPSPSKYYSACPLTLTEQAGTWSEPTTTALTLLPPQQLDILRHYFTRKMTTTFVDDDSKTVSSSSTAHRVYARLEFVSSTTPGFGSTWGVADNIIFNRTQDTLVVTLTCRVVPADPIARAAHPEAVERQFTFTLLPAAFAPVVGTDYLLFYLNSSDYRFPFDDGVDEGNPVKPYGMKSRLSWPKNAEITWQIEADGQGFVRFRNVKTGHYAYFDAEDYSASDYGMLKMGTDTPGADTRYLFRLFRLAKDGTYGDSILSIIPYSKQFVVFKSDGRSNNIFSGLGVDYTNKVLTVNKPADYRWKFYPYEVEDTYRLKDNFTIGIPAAIKVSNTLAIAREAAVYNFTAESYHWLSIKNAPANNTELEIAGTGSRQDIAYDWTITDLDDHLASTTYSSTGTNNSTFAVDINNMPRRNTFGSIKVVASVDTHGPKSATVEIELDLFPIATDPVVFTDITSLSEITDQYGNYRLTVDNPSGYPALGDKPFMGTLDGNWHTVGGLDRPLFAELNGAVVCNLSLDNVSISGHSGPTGAVAGVAKGGSCIYNIGILAGSVGSADGYCGTLVGEIDGLTRVINCFSYASVGGGTTVGGMVGYNHGISTSNQLRTMVMNCMYYGDRISGTTVSPIYGGEMIRSNYLSGTDAGINNYCYFSQSTVLDGSDTVYNCALEMEHRYMNRFEFYRLLLNSNRELAGWYATNAIDADHTVMGKWVLETADRTISNPKPYPVLKPLGKYPSIINPDAAHAPTDAPANTGGKMGELAVTVQMGSGGARFAAPTGASLSTSSLALPITDKDTARFNFNYRKVQLPYYNDLGSGNYTDNRVVTGWKITSITGGTPGTFAAGDDAEVDTDGNITRTYYNFADRHCTNKDLYSASQRVFNQGAYWDVPEGVTAITIEPYWAKCSYLSDSYYDRTYNTTYGNATDFALPGQRYKNNTAYLINGSSQKVFTGTGDALKDLDRKADATVYDYALVLVGNFHMVGSVINGDKLPFTFMSVDLDHDNEPDYAHICQTGSRTNISPIMFDFVNSIGLGMAQKPNGSVRMAGWGIPFPTGWFEVSNTTLIRFTEFEADGNNGKDIRPVILQGGIYEQFVSMATSKNTPAIRTSYLTVGGNAWFALFNNGAHGNNNANAWTKHTPVNVLGGDYDVFYVTGYFNTNAATQASDNAECYISGGRFGELAGTGMEGVGGNMVWQIYGAEISNFYGGGINVNKPILGNIVVDISQSNVDVYCGGPKFGDMATGKKVFTTATDCNFGTYFGAGYGGTAYNIPRIEDRSDYPNYNYDGFITQHYKRRYDASKNGIAVNIEHELFAVPAFDNDNNVCRFRVKYASLSLATTHSVVSRLTGCTVRRNFYGGGNLGKVAGDATSTLTSCTVLGNVFGAGFSAAAPTCPVMPLGARYIVQPYYNQQTGAYTTAVMPPTVLYTWHHADAVSPGNEFDEANHFILTTVDMSGLGTVEGTATLTIGGNSRIGLAGTDGTPDHGNVFGGGEESAVNTNTSVTLMGNTEVMGNVYGGGYLGKVRGNSSVSIAE